MSENLVKVWRATDLHDAEMLKGIYTRHMYPWHAHEELSLGLVVDGAITLHTRTRSGTAKRGSFVLINTEEMHRGSPDAPGGWSCRTMHLHPEAIRRAAEELKRFTRHPGVAFRGPTFEDAELSRALLALHRHSETENSSLERQSRMVALLSRLLARHAETHLRLPENVHEPLAVQRARAFLDENLSDKVTLDELAAVSCVTPFRLLRAFQRATGLTPHAYQVQARVRVAHALLRSGEPLANIAAAVGFADQAHMTRVFKRIMGATPGQYRATAQS
jgi:AraC-like DNA-binding protein